MYARKKGHGRLWPSLLALIIVASALAGVAVAKYIQTTTFTGTLQFNAKLAEEIKILESEALRNVDGSYRLGSNTVSENTYVLIPGVDIPKDPHVVITDKTSIEAFLYVEVVDKTNSAIDWRMNADWLELEGVEGKKDKGTVYVYAPAGIPKVLGKQAGDATYYLLENNEILVSQKLLSAQTADDTLTFYAAMGEVNAVADTNISEVQRAKEVYNVLVKKVAS